MMKNFTHIDSSGNAKMVDVTDKVKTCRIAHACGNIYMNASSIESIKNDELKKGNVLTTAKIAGIQAAKKTAGLIPMCHQLHLLFVDIKFIIKSNSIEIQSVVKTQESTGVEIEALTAVSVAALTIYDMCKAIDKKMSIGEIELTFKDGGKHSHSIDYRPNVGVITLSDSISESGGEDVSGKLLVNGFKSEGCCVDNYIVLSDGSKDFLPTIDRWIHSGIELIITTGGTGVGPRDLTIDSFENYFDTDLPGIEQAIHEYGRKKVRTAILSRLKVGMKNKSIIIALPGSPNAVKDALQVLIPSIFHSFHMINGEKHG